jgi:tetratricopeptide (TPR) repeat protein
MAQQPQHIRNSAIELNNRGVQLLRNGDLPEAICVIAQGLDMMKTILESPRTVETQTESVVDEDFDGMIVEDLNLSFMETSCDHINSLYYQQQQSYVFCSPTEIPSDAALPSLKVSLLMVFNLALAHHLNGIQVSDYDQLEKALRLYECVYRISHEEEVDLSVLHAMALTNNLGHIHLILEDTQKSQKCFEQLLATLIYYVEVSDGQNEREIESMKGFFSNATGLSMIKSTAPAA